MIGGKRVLGLIPARGGSKRLPGKNLKNLGGKPLIAWTIEHGLAAHSIDRLVVSSDDPNVLDVARARGAEAPFVRPAELATDQATSVAVALHALDALAERFDILVLLQPTSPLRTADDIEACVQICVDSPSGACVSVTEAPAHPYRTYWLSGDRLEPVLSPDAPPQRRQDTLPTAYVFNGAVYAIETERLRAHRGFRPEGTFAHVMPRERSVDVDDAVDFALAELLIAGINRVE